MRSCHYDCVEPILGSYSLGKYNINKCNISDKLLIFDNNINKYIYIYIYSSNLVRMGCKTYILHHPIKDCHINILFKIQYILPHLITS